MQQSNDLTAFPPSGMYGVERGRSNSSLTANRLRATSDMYSQGIITSDERAKLKHLLLIHDDDSFRHNFDAIQRTGDSSRIRELLRNAPTINEDFSFIDLSDMTIDDFGHMGQETATFDDAGFQYPSNPVPISSSYQNDSRLSIGFGSEFSAPAPISHMSQDMDYRKRVASNTLPTQGYAKHNIREPNMMVRQPQPHKNTGFGQTMNQLDAPSVMASPSETSLGSQEYDGDDGDGKGSSKTKKNERERKRRLVVTKGFKTLHQLLISLEEARIGNDLNNPIDVNAKIDKTVILRCAYDRIQILENQILALKHENQRLRAMNH